MEQNKVDASNGFRFNQIRPKVPFWTGSNSFTLPSSQTFPHSSKAINPNKAVFTIDAKTGQIFIVNNKACQLLGYTSRELRNKPFFELLHSKSESHINALAEMQIDSDEGTVILLSGKVIEMKTKQNSKVVVSLWIRQIDTDGRCIAVAEPVERRVCQIQVDRLGTITHADIETLTIFQYDSVEQIIGVGIISLIPAIKLPEPDTGVILKGFRKQRATGRTTDNIKFPLCLLIATHEYADSNHLSAFDITVWVFQNLSGLIVIDEFGSIQTCNQPFSLLMFGYNQDKILNMHISTLIPNFGKDLVEDRSRNVTNSSLTSNEWEADVEYGIIDKEISLSNQKKPILKEEDRTISSIGELSEGACFEDNIKPNTNSEQFSTEQKLRQEFIRDSTKQMKLEVNVNVKTTDSNLTLDDVQTPVNICHEFPTRKMSQSQTCSAPFVMSQPSPSAESTPSSAASSKPLSCVDGDFIGEGIHADGNIIDILYSVSTQVLPCTRRVYCIWICRDPNTSFENDKNTNLTLTFNSFTSTVEHSLGQVIKTTAAQNSSRPNSISLVSKYEDELLIGDFSKYYTTLKQIGKGAYGYVKMAFRNADRLLVITKFILKEKLCAQFMMKNSENREIPIEIHLLQTLKHPNIVSVLDVFENDLFFQMVMEKHGSGMDLFEFIERRPLMDEKLGSFIFRQIANAVHYLHGLGILHRDIKDENIIIDHNFHVKLIDFGSATFMEEGKLFSTFYGTTEYCSPEVLAGNQYAGPELEMWSLGVTLYVLMFFENPFIDVEETLRADLQIPHKVSEFLECLLNGMLHKDPAYRYTMKQLNTDPWITQEVNPALFNFTWIVPCKSHEVNPEIYFSGQLYSSTSVLSTISPQESLSLVDECSIIGSDDGKNSTNKSTTDLLNVTENRTLNNSQEETASAKTIVELDDDDENKTTHSCQIVYAPNDCEQQNGSSSSSSGFLKKLNRPYYSLSKMNVSDMSLDRDYNASMSPSKKFENIRITEFCARESDTDLRHSMLDNRHLQVKDVTNKLSCSKSENNIFEEKLEPCAVFNVVSLHDVNIKEPTLNYKMEDLSNLNISNETFDINLEEFSMPTK